MISKPKGISVKRWGSGVLVGAVSVLVMGVPFAPAANAAAASLSATPTSQNVQAGGTAAFTVTTTGTPHISYSLLSNGGNAATGSAFPAGTTCTNSTTNSATCSIVGSGTGGTVTARLFDDANTNGSWDTGELFQDVTIVYSTAPFSIALTPDTNTSTVGTCVMYTVNATDSGGRPSVGRQVDVSIASTGFAAGGVVTTCAVTGGSTINAEVDTAAGAGGGSSSTTFNVLTGDGTGGTTAGQAIFGIQSTSTGSSTVTAASHANSSVSDTSTQTWTAGGPNAVTSLTVTAPTSQNAYTGDTVSYTVTAKDASGNPVSGVTVNKGVTSGAAADAAFYPTDGSKNCGATSNVGQVTCSFTNQGGTGTDNFEFWVNQTSGAGPHTAGPDSGEPTATATATFATSPTVSAVTTTCTTPGATTGGQTCKLPPGQTSVTFTANVVNGATPVSGAFVSWAITGTASGTPTSGTSTTDASGNATFTVTVAAANAVNGNTVTATAHVDGQPTGANNAATATYQTRAATTFTLTPALETVTNGGTASFVAKVVDQFSTGVSGVTVSYTVSGRNAGKTGTVTTGSDGTAAISYTDTAVNPSSSQDTVSATVTSGALTGSNQMSTVQYITGTTTASTVAVDVSGNGSLTTCPATTNSATTKSVALGSSNSICANVQNSTSQALAGKSVTITVDKGTITAVSNGGTISTDKKSATTTTNGSGNVTATVTSNNSGAQKVTVTADSASGTGTITYAAPAVQEARNVAIAPATATVNSGTSQVFTATATDEFGNTVPGVTVVFTQTGPGSFSGSSSSTGTTNTNGQATATLTTLSTDSGSGSVTADITDHSAFTFNNCGMAAGQNDFGADANAKTAGNCTATSTYTVKTAAAPSTVTVSAPNGTTGKVETASAAVKNSDGTPAAAGFVVQFSVSGANNATGSATTNASGVAKFSYTPHSAGNDTITAIVNTGGTTSPSGSKTIKISPAQKAISAVISCSSPSKHHLRCRVQEAPHFRGLTVVLKDGSGHVLGRATTNSSGVAVITKSGLKSHKRLHLHGHINASSRTKAANTNTVSVRIK